MQRCELGAWQVPLAALAQHLCHVTSSDAPVRRGDLYSHSMVAGGFDEMSRQTRLTEGISLMMRLEIVSSRS